jgi:cellulase
MRIKASTSCIEVKYSVDNMKSALVLLAAVASVSAHSTWQELWVGSEDKASTCVRKVKDNSPVDSLSSADMFCGRGPASTDGVCEVAGTYSISNRRRTCR